ncbi:MAG: DUF429 domain-containing protein [Actinophytocola sp.]|uniref:DUF429 domain-containing protein n=1 Tax=Actinophytocola sp. TaxID=1872138 RepID=UPI001327BAE1|nr:DUF429 domain-containing protein [Actinophytocola sp.]MPZ82952.1 DUF429 domain-containing protein [Actinophytocola sp.]
MTERVLGVDACKAGWVGIALTGDHVEAYQARTIGDLVADAWSDGPLDVVAIDIPIGLPDKGQRAADLAARGAVGTILASSVFMTPVRTALEFPRHADASKHNVELTGKGMSIQAYGILPKVREVDLWRSSAPCRVVEVHPEVSFAELAGASLTIRKSTWAGAALRRRLLADEGIVIPDSLGVAGERAAVDDVLDAAVAAWTARRVHQGKARSFPEEFEIFSDGVECAIWR